MHHERMEKRLNHFLDGVGSLADLFSIGDYQKPEPFIFGEPSIENAFKNVGKYLWNTIEEHAQSENIEKNEDFTYSCRT